jgi:hypothetical protein
VLLISYWHNGCVDFSRQPPPLMREAIGLFLAQGQAPSPGFGIHGADSYEISADMCAANTHNCQATRVSRSCLLATARRER